MVDISATHTNCHWARRDRKESEKEESNSLVDTFAKSAGWYRLIYGDLRHGLDFRLLSNQRVAILDASHSLFDGSARGSTDSAMPTSNDPPNIGLQPIPDLSVVINESVLEAVAAKEAFSGKLAVIEWGVVTDKTAVKSIMKRIHHKVWPKLYSSP
ncbi:hypothetical protein MPER_01113 [Moniliophthora perniciosa FA553]|nr:hypothetical protein MPER_01113 [Moniliophthora perniciosa FA553]